MFHIALVIGGNLMSNITIKPKAFGTSLLLFALCLMSGCLPTQMEKQFTPYNIIKSAGLDEHTVALWLFDEPQYPHMTLTDAGPNFYDLRLLGGGKMVPGRFGNAVKLCAQPEPAVIYAEIPNVVIPPLPQLYRPTDAPVKLLKTLAQGQWTWEFWLRVDDAPEDTAVILDMAAQDKTPLYCALEPQLSAFILRSDTAGFYLSCQTNLSTLTNGRWHHIAFTWEHNSQQLIHFLDGQPQPLPSPHQADVSIRPEDIRDALEREVMEVCTGSPQKLIEVGPAWRFKKDIGQTGLAEKWFLTEYEDSDWLEVYSDHDRGDRAHNFDDTGYAWYRAKVKVPSEFAEMPLLTLLFEAVDGEGTIYINGKPVYEHTVEATGLTLKNLWRTPLTIPVKALFNPDGINTIAVRVKNIIPGASIFRPVHLIGSQVPVDSRFLPDLVGVSYRRANFVVPEALDQSGQIDLQQSSQSEGSRRLRGYIRAPIDGNVTIIAEGTGKVRLKLAGLAVPEKETKSNFGYVLLSAAKTEVPMKKSQMWPITLEHSYSVWEGSHGEGGKLLGLYWSWPGQPMVPIPSEYLSHNSDDSEIIPWALVAKFDERVFDIRLGSDITNHRRLAGFLDEMRISDVVRYRKDFKVPESFSYNYGKNAPPPSQSNGPALLFGPNTKEPLHLGSRKHVFIDDAILQKSQNVHLQPNQPLRREIVNLPITTGTSVGNSFYEHEGRIVAVYSQGTRWMSGQPYRDTQLNKNMHLLVYSEDGLNFAEYPDLGVIEYDGSSENNIVLNHSASPSMGWFFKDTNPAATSDERFKYTSYLVSRGLYLFTSPDGIHWKRNETIMYPFDCGGSVESFWDDQWGQYFSYIRHEAKIDFGRRMAALGRTSDVTKPWPFKPQAKPDIFYFYSLPGLDTELPIPFAVDGIQRYKSTGQIRQFEQSGAFKYLWAPDTYVAFIPHKMRENPDAYSEIELAVSRDGLDWKFFGEPHYTGIGWELEGEKIMHVSMHNGQIQRDNEIWHYGRALTSTRRPLSFRQIHRLDGYVSIDATPSGGSATTRLLTFDGETLQLNVSAKGQVRVAILNPDGSPVTGFSVEDCKSIRGDHIRHEVSWGKGTDVGTLAGKPVRLQFELADAKLYAFQFVKR
jgi:hypothetical protein